MQVFSKKRSSTKISSVSFPFRTRTLISMTEAILGQFIERKTTMLTIKRKSARRISVWTLLFALMLCLISGTMTMGVGATMTAEPHQSPVKDAADDLAQNAGDAIKDAGDAVKDLGDDLKIDAEQKLDDAPNGMVTDRDGWIGNRDGGKSVMEMADGSMGWVAWVIAVIVAILAIVLAIILIPRKKED